MPTGKEIITSISAIMCLMTEEVDVHIKSLKTDTCLIPWEAFAACLCFQEQIF